MKVGLSLANNPFIQFGSTFPFNPPNHWKEGGAGEVTAAAVWLLMPFQLNGGTERRETT